jgi:hypothetical protein
MSCSQVVVAFVVFSFLLVSYVPVVVQWVPEAGGCVLPFPRELYAHFVVATTFVSISPLALICCGNIVIVVVLVRQSRERARLMGGGRGKTAGMIEQQSRPALVLDLLTYIWCK